MTQEITFDSLENLPRFDDSFSNCDHSEPVGAEEALRKAPLALTVEHPAWDHFGLIVFDGTRFVEVVRRYRQDVATVVGDSLEEVFDAVNDEWGDE